MKAQIIKLKKGDTTIVQIKSSNTAIPNMIRTILQTEIPVYALDIDNIEYGDCDIIFPNERIDLILGLISVKQTLSDDVTFSLHAKFDKNNIILDDTTYESRNIIMSDDIKSSNGLKYFHPNIPIIELRKSAGVLNINKIKLIRKTQLYNARHQACKVLYEIIEEGANYVICQLTIKPTSKRYPIYSVDTFDALKQAINIFINNCKLVRNNIENDVYIMSESKINNPITNKELQLFKYQITDQLRQFGYVIQSQIYANDDYNGKEYLIGYHNVHPLERQLILIMQWDTTYHKGKPKDFIIKCLTNLIKTLGALRLKS